MALMVICEKYQQLMVELGASQLDQNFPESQQLGSGLARMDIKLGIRVIDHLVENG